MKNKYSIIVLLLISTLFVFNCSEVKDDISQPEDLPGVHPEGFGSMGSDNFHLFKIQEKQWDLTGCKKCHGNNYAGGTTGVSCLDCHTDGPESCNTCHGDFNDNSRIAPPTDLANNFYTTARGVGAHTVHVYETQIALGIGCYDCHPGNATDGDYIVTHSDGPPAEMSLADGSYDAVSLTCSDTYCHGNFEFGTVKGNNFSPVWNIVDGTQAACGTCHGKVNGEGVLTPTPVGHFGNFSADQCKGCHPDTFNEDGSLNPFIHMNGEANVN